MRETMTAESGIAAQRPAPLDKAGVLPSHRSLYIDGGNPVHEMEGDVANAAAQLDFFAGLVTEMKGHSVPLGRDSVNFSVREPRGLIGRIIPL